MKSKSTLLMSAAGLLTMLAIPAPAQESPPPKPANDTPVNEARANDTPRPRNEPPRSRTPRAEAPPAARAPAEKMTPFVGVLTREISPELRAQFGLEPGFGLIVEEVMPESPAKAAGIKEHDILVAFDDQRLVNMEQLMALVRSRKKDESVTLTVISGGKENRVQVTIGERMMPERPEPHHFFGMRPGSGFPGTDRDRDDRHSGMPPRFPEQIDKFQQQMRENQERFQQQMREYQERIQGWVRDGSRGTMPQPPIFHGPGARQDPRRHDHETPGEPKPRESRGNSDHETHQSASVTRSDETGVYSLRSDDRGTVFSARPKDGAEKTWTVTTEEERRAVPEQLRGKLQELERLRADLHRDGPKAGSRPRAQEDPPARRAPEGDQDRSRERAPDPRGGSPSPRRDTSSI